MWPLVLGILISIVCNDPIIIQRLLLTLFFIDNKTKPNTIIESFPCWNSCVWVLHCCITSLFMVSHQWYYIVLEYFIKCALDFCNVRIKLLGLTFKGKQNIFPHQQTLSLPTITLHHLHSKATMMPIVIHSQQEPLSCTWTQQGSLAAVQIVLSFLLSLLIYAFGVWEAVNVSM